VATVRDRLALKELIEKGAAKDLEDSDRITTYIGTYTRRESFVDGKGKGIYIYQLDPRTGELTYADTVTGAGTTNPSFVTLGPDKRFLYAVNEITGGEGSYGIVSAFAIHPVTKGLNYLNQQSTGGLAPCYVCIEPEGRYCLVANYETGSICVLPVQNDGRLGLATDTVQFTGSGPQRERQQSSHAHMVVLTPVSHAILVVDLGGYRLLLFRLDMEKGTLSPNDLPWVQLPPGTGPRHVAFHPNRPFVYIISELQSTITGFRYQAEQETIEAPKIISTLPADFTGQNLGGEIKIAPSGRFVYASNRGHNSLAIYRANQMTGQLSLVEHESTQGVGPRDFCIDPSGAMLLVANQDTDTVVTFWIDQDSGTLRATGNVTAVPTPVCLQLYNA
jgi:6-phosphogluconolactonase